MTDDSPRLRIGPFETRGEAGAWTVRWPIVNEGDRTVRLVSALQPHSQFRASERRIDLDLPPGAGAEVSLPVRFSEPSGTVVENPFLIVHVDDGRAWRVMARVRVTAGPHAEPIAGPEVVTTTQKIRGPS